MSKIGKYITSPQFMTDAEKAVEKAIAEQREQGIEPAYQHRTFDTPEVNPELHASHHTDKFEKAFLGEVERSREEGRAARRYLVEAYNKAIGEPPTKESSRLQEMFINADNGIGLDGMYALRDAYLATIKAITGRDLTE